MIHCRPRSVQLFSIASLLLLSACGGASSNGGASGATSGAGAAGATSGGAATSGAGAGGATASGGSAGSGGALASGGASAGVRCPDTPPADGDPCTAPWELVGSTFGETITAHCSWGDDPRPDCRTTALCQDGAWQVSAPSPSECGELLPAGCSTSPPEAASACPDTATSCWYEDGTRCWCSDCARGSAYPICQTVDPPEWACAAPVDNCPFPLPQAGAPCAVEGTNCGLDCSSPLRCRDGHWQWLRCASCCPICAAPNTPVATPYGERPIASLRVGDLVYSVDHDAIRAVPLVRVGRTPVSAHHVMRVVLRGGRTLEISPGHPTADGRKFGDLRPGVLLDEQHEVVSVELVPYSYDATYDILPASSTGTYFAAGALIGSTLD
jgi:hypothetical protein